MINTTTKLKPPFKLAIFLGLLIVSSFFVDQVSSSTDYCTLLKDSLLFFKANRAGRLKDNDVPWRGNSALNDASPGSSPNADGDGNLSGGYYDAGDGVKFGLPACYTMTMLSWAYVEFESGISACGLKQMFLDTIKHGTDFILACHLSENEFVAQVGSGHLDHAFWGPPENMTMERPVFILSPSAPGTEVAMECSAALSAASIAFSSADPSYSSQCVTHAKQLYNFGKDYPATYTDSVPDAKAFYNSFNGYQDEIVWGSLWLYRATNEASLLEKAKVDYNAYGINYKAIGNTISWDLKAPGCTLLLYQITKDKKYQEDTESSLNFWLPGGGITYTPGGLAFKDEWGPCRYAMSATFLASVYRGSEKYTDFAKKQLDYVIGNNPNKQSFVVGYGPNAPLNPHHRAAHGSTVFKIEDPPNNRHILLGALVGGPGPDDSYEDLRSDYKKNEVALDYQAGFVGTIAAHANASTTKPPSSEYSTSSSATPGTTAFTGGEQTSTGSSSSSTTSSSPTSSTTSSTSSSSPTSSTTSSSSSSSTSSQQTTTSTTEGTGSTTSTDSGSTTGNNIPSTTANNNNTDNSVSPTEDTTTSSTPTSPSPQPGVINPTGSATGESTTGTNFAISSI
eukprot:gene2741-3404_t